jgi:predicted ATP-dependent serine protease
MNGAPEGRRNVMLFKAAKDMQEQGYAQVEVERRLQSMIDGGGDWSTDYVNDKDRECINNAFKEDPLYDKREGKIIRPSIFNFQRLDQMIEEAGEINWLADNLLTEGGFSLMVGPPKAGKSTIVRQLVKSVCHGDHFLGRDVTQGRVLYLTFEEQPAVLKKQFEAVGMTGHENLMIHVGNVFAEQKYVYEDIEAALDEYEPTLVVLDTLFDIIQLESINDYKEVKMALAKMRTIARRTGAHILGVHHTNKGGEGNNSIMGSNAIHGALDTLIRFVQEGERRYLFSNGKHGQHFIDQEIVYDYKTMTYELGRKRDRGEDKL